MDWSVISPMLQDPLLHNTLPTVPSLTEASALYGSQCLEELVPFTLSNFATEAKLCDDSTPAAARAGPLHTCTTSTCKGVSGEQCRAVINGASILLRGKLGTWWAKALGTPAWMQFTFPAIPDNSPVKLQFKFTLDSRYRPEMNGGNACISGSDSYDCQLCAVEESWDHKVPAGVHVLWSAAGRDNFVISGPFELGSAWDAGEFMQTIESPDDFMLGQDEFPIVTLLMVFQYPRQGEVGNPSHCSISHSTEGSYAYKDKSFMVKDASVSYQQVSKPPPTNTDWSPISPLLDDPQVWHLLPPIPCQDDVSALYGEDPNSSTSLSSAKNAPFALHQINNFAEEASLCDKSSNFAAARAGPEEICTSDSCSGLPIGSEQCRAVINSQSIQLSSRLGTHWAKAIGNPAWMQFSFPAIPDNSSNFYFSFTLDDRYRPELYGGNPCANSSSSSGNAGYECQLCTTGTNWDQNVKAGVHVLWTAAGRDEFEITGPFELGTAYDNGDFVQTLEAPAEMNYMAGEFPIVTLMTFSQYPAMGEVTNPSSCSISESTESGYAYRDKPLMVKQVSMMYRSKLEYSKEPSVDRPRLYGTDAEWLSTHVDPFFNVPCNADTASNVGWFENEGFLSFKSHFDIAARGFYSCEGGGNDDGNIGSWSSLRDYFVPNEYPNQIGGFRALHLLRRQWACSRTHGGDYSPCEYNSTETSRLASAVASKELERFRATSWSCGYACGGNGDATFDLTTAEQVSYFVHFFDVMVSEGTLLSAQDIEEIQTTLDNQIKIFVAAFWTGKWQLWNGNNWTPHLCVAALEWAIVFWHEYHDLAVEVLGIVNDIMWLHREYYTSDGVYTEGVAMYGFMSLEGQMTMAALSQASFGFSPAAIDVETIEKTASFLISSMATDGYLVDFGDSHGKRGWTNPMAVIEAAIPRAIVYGEAVTNASIDHNQWRAFSASLYGSGGFYSNPWRIRGQVLQFDNLLHDIREPPQHLSQPLGPKRVDVFEEGGYARFLAPLLDTNESLSSSGPVCFFDNTMCIDQALPSLADNIPYSSISLQGRPNSFAHSEVDFGTFTWSAWGSRLISDFGYGTIATAVSEWDMRRYTYLDNNPAGHNTIVIREAFQPGSDDKINFSQLNYVAGNTSRVTFDGTDNGSSLASCVLLDGSEPYGASRPDGWLDVMKRYVCDLGSISGSSNLILDLLQTKAGRTELNLVGSQYGGPDFAEPSPASQRLTIDEYFYVDTEADIEMVDGHPQEILPFSRNSKKWCSHVDAEVFDDGSSVALWPVCGIGGYRPGDGMGLISGISLLGSSQGYFEYDGLITSVDRWLTPNALKKRRFRFVSNQTVGPEGDVRAFVLSPSNGAANPLQQGPTSVPLENCSLDFGCETLDRPMECSCLQLCVESVTKRVIIVHGELSSIEDIGYCGTP